MLEGDRTLAAKSQDLRFELRAGRRFPAKAPHDPFGVPWITFGDVFRVCMSISLEKRVPEALGAGFGLILVIFNGFWGLFFVFLGGCRGGKNSVSCKKRLFLHFRVTDPGCKKFY